MTTTAASRLLTRANARIAFAALMLGGFLIGGGAGVARFIWFSGQRTITFAEIQAQNAILMPITWIAFAALVIGSIGVLAVRRGPGSLLLAICVAIIWGTFYGPAALIGPWVWERPAEHWKVLLAAVACFAAVAGAGIALIIQHRNPTAQD